MPRTKHGYARRGIKSKLYYVWNQMRRRCSYKKFRYYSRYGGRGISVCKEWDNDFSVFMDWAFKNGYKNGLSIDRIDNDGNYCPSNCRFVTMRKNIQNTKTFNGGAYQEGNKYRAQIKLNGKSVRIGMFASRKEAEKAYRLACDLIENGVATKENIQEIRNSLCAKREPKP